jgi:hypothetical protein
MPVPDLVRPPVPVMTEARTVMASSSEISVPLPSAMVPPAPESEPTVMLLPLRSKKPPLTVSAPVAGRNAPAPSRRVPSLTVVPPR